MSVFLVIAFFWMNTIGLVNGSGLLRAQELKQFFELLNSAEENYHSGNFNQAIELANQALEDPSASEMDKQRAYIILSKVSLALEQPDLAKKYLTKVLEINPSYQPTIEEETPQFVNFVAQVRTQYVKTVKKSNRKGLMKWMAVGVGALITVTVVAVMASGTENPEEKQDTALSEPPAFP
jgi:tetratricopeptide (TPR) repeat protein